MATEKKITVEGVQNPSALEDLLYQTLETELGGAQVYTAAVKACLLYTSRCV